jgi:signal transduction histidine kinase
VTDRIVVVGRRVAAIVATPDVPLVSAAALCLAALIEILLREDRDSAQLVFAIGATMSAALVSALPTIAAFGAAAPTLVILLTAHQPPLAVQIAAIVTFYVAGRRLRRWLLALLGLPFVAYAVLVEGQERRFLGVALAAAFAAAAGLGLTRRVRREAAERQASQQAIADTLLEHVARGERARIARELHDVVAHHISMIAVQAETARLTTPGLPAEGAKRLSAIGDTARAALTEMRRLLGVLREDAGTEPTRRPQPGLEQLNELIDEAREATGASTRLILRGRVVPLDPGVELTAYRIVQEALTNTRRHAPGAAVDVELGYADDALLVRVRDNGPGPPDGAAHGGHGLVGMRERATMVGGSVRVGPAPGCGLLIEAVLPVGAAEER